MKKIILALFLLATYSLFAQENKKDTLSKSLETVEVAAMRLTLTDVKAPLAVSVLEKKRLQTATQQLSPYEVLGSVAGVFAQNPDNFSQDLRISIRGFGARAAFGIRGIRIFTDGLPEGTPDGQADVDNLDMGVVQKMEILRGAASGLYGNAAGGVVYMTTENPTERTPLLEAQTSLGSYGFQRYQMKIGQNFGKLLYFVNGSHNRTEGYRAWSQMQNTILNAKLTYFFTPNFKVSLLANYGTSPTANDAGGLTKLQADTNRRQAHSNNLLYQVGESVTQNRFGATFDAQFAKNHSLQGRVFYTQRHLENRLAIFANGYGDLRRAYGGAGLNYQLDSKILSKQYRLKLGLDIENQRDTRERYGYARIAEGGITRFQKDKLALSQKESFDSYGLFLLQDYQPTDQLLLSLGVRYDDLTLKNTDLFLTDGDQSGNRHYQKFNPSAGINYQFDKKTAVYANYSTSFETPTLNELSNNPTLLGGFNPNLEPQSAQSFEIGLKAKTTEGGKIDVAVFQILTENDLVPYAIAGQLGKVFYRNAGKTQRHGIELNFFYPIFKHLDLFFNHTVSNFSYQSYTANNINYDGKTLPGIPQNYGQIEMRYTPENGFYTIAQYRYAQKNFANDANTFSADGYGVLNLRVGKTFLLKKVAFEPFLSVNNVLNKTYIANVQINATTDRYFEPATLRYFFGGLKMRLK